MWRLLHQAALGLDYIHNNGVVQGKLKLNNILVDAEAQAQLSDSGHETLRSCVMLSICTGTTSSGLRWCAPESLRARPLFASDEYSLAMYHRGIEWRTSLGFSGSS